MKTLLTAKINMISVSQPNHSYKAKEPTGLYEFQRGAIFWFEFNPRGIRNDWDYCRYLEMDQGFRRPQLLLFTERRRGSQQQGLCLAHASIASGLLEAFCVLQRTGRQPAHSKFLEDTASVNRDQALSPLSLASPKTGSAHTDMQRCRGSNVAWHCPPLGGLGICLCRASVVEQKLKDIFWGWENFRTSHCDAECGGTWQQMSPEKPVQGSWERQKKLLLTDSCPGSSKDLGLVRAGPAALPRCSEQHWCLPPHNSLYISSKRGDISRGWFASQILVPAIKERAKSYC